MKGIFLALTLALVACGGGGSTQSGRSISALIDNDIVAGLWYGTMTVAGQDCAALAMIHNNEMHLLSGMCDVVMVGTVAVNVDTSTIDAATTDYYPAESSSTTTTGERRGSSVITGEYTADSTISASFVSDYGIQGTLLIAPHEYYNWASSLELLAETWTQCDRLTNQAVWAIDDLGNINGSDPAGCSYSGSFSVVDPFVNLYGVTVSTSNCGTADGTYTGVAMLQGFGSDTMNMQLAAHNSTHMLGISMCSNWH